MQYLVFVFLAPAAAVVLLFILSHAWQRRSVPGAKELIIYLALVTGFLIGNTLELINPTSEGTLAWAKFNYFFIAFIPIAWMAYALEYSGHAAWLAPQRFWLFCIQPLLTFIFSQTNDQYHLIWQDYSFHRVLGSFMVMDVQSHMYGQWFWVNVLYSYIMVVAGLLLIGREHFVLRLFYRRQSLWTLSGAFVPLMVNAFYIFDVFPWLKKDFSPIGFATAGIFFALGIFRQRPLNLTPIARNVLVELLPDGILMLDETLRIADFNPAAREILRLPSPDPIGLKITDVWPESRVWMGDLLIQQHSGPGKPGQRPAYMDLPTRPDVIYVNHDSHRRAYSLLITPISVPRSSRFRRGKKTEQNGWLLLLSDVTRRIDAERALSQANTKLRGLNDVLEARVAARTADLSRRAAELETLARVSSHLRKTSSLQEMLDIILSETVGIVSASSGAIFLVEGTDLQLRAHLGPAFSGLQENLRHTPTIDPLWDVVETGEIRLLHRPPHPLGHPDELFYRIAGEHTALMIAPFRATNHTVGLLVLAFAEEPAPPGEDLEEDGAADDHRLRLLEDNRRPLLAIAEMAGNAFQRVRTMENLEALVAARTRNLSVLYEVTSTTNAYIDPPEMLQRVLETVLDELNLCAAVAHMINEDGSLGLVATAGFDSNDVKLLPAPHDPASPWQQVLTSNNPYVQQSLAQPMRAWDRQLCSCVSLPVRAHGSLLGVMTVLEENMRRLGPEDMALLGAIADNVAVAVERAQLRMRARDAAVMEERQRLARDLHDSVTQSLYSLSLFSQAGTDALTSGDTAKTAHYLERLGETGQQALREMRLMIYELRPLALQRVGLAGALRHRLDAVERRARIDAKLEIKQEAPLPEAVEIGLFGVAQEALNNIIKHAHASQVYVRLSVYRPCPEPPQEILTDIPQELITAPALHGPYQVELEISDNGKGIQTSELRSLSMNEGEQPERSELTIPEGGMGLSSMRERVNKLGGAFSIRSSTGHGTTVLVTLQVKEVPIEQ